jgi:hypothetical protein
MFSGATSWSMEQLFEHTEESRPRWWWLHAQTVGLYKSEPVEQKVVTSDSLKLKPDVVITGRLPERANGKVCAHAKWPHNAITTTVLHARTATYAHARSQKPFVFFRSTELTCGSSMSAVGGQRTSTQSSLSGSISTRSEGHGACRTPSRVHHRTRLSKTTSRHPIDATERGWCLALGAAVATACRATRAPCREADTSQIQPSSAHASRCSTWQCRPARKHDTL